MDSFLENSEFKLELSTLFSTDHLPVNEKMFFGDESFSRGFPQASFSANNGGVLNLEFGKLLNNYKNIIQNSSLFLFHDFGYVSNPKDMAQDRSLPKSQLIQATGLGYRGSFFRYGHLNGWIAMPHGNIVEDDVVSYISLSVGW
ncbi:unnamed protein product [Chrysoparadoxa australica]